MSLSRFEKFSEVPQGIHDYKLVPLSAHLGALRKASTVSEKSALIYSIISLYTVAPPLATVSQFCGAFSDITALLSLFFDKPEPLSQEVPFQCITPMVPDMEPVPVQIDLATGSESFSTLLVKQLPQIKDWVANNSGVIKAVVGALAMAAIALGLPSVLEATFSTDSVKKFIHLGTLLASTKGVWNSLSGVLDSFLTWMYAMFGMEYVAPEHKLHLQLSTKIEKLHCETRDFLNKTKVDFFGVQLYDIAQLQQRYETLNKAYTLMVSNQKSLFNFAARLGQITTMLTEINDIVVDIQKSSGGKQRPAVVWFAGSPGCGKTETSIKLARDLAKKHNSSVYSRTYADEFWSAYQYQAVVTMDDMMQKAGQKDIDEFHRYTSSDQKDVIGASLEAKGRPFVAKYIVVTSNHTWIAPPTQFTDYKALNRRRDVVVFFHNPYLEQYVAEHSGSYPTEDSSFWKEHPTKMYLVNPTYGHTLANVQMEAQMKFHRDAPWVIREISYEEIFNSLYHLQQQRAEIFRQRLLTNPAAIPVTIPDVPFVYDQQYILGSDKTGARKIEATPDEVSSGDYTHVSILGLTKTFSSPCAGLNAEYQELFKKFSDEIDSTTKEFPKNLQDGAARRQLAHKIFKARENPDEAVWLAVEGDLYLGSNNLRPSYVVDQFDFQRDNIVVYDFDKDYKSYEIYVNDRSGDGLQQSNPVVVLPSVIKNTCVLLQGPPGYGKTYAVKTAFPDFVYFDWEDKEAKVSLANVNLFDDITISQERFVRFKELLATHYESKEQVRMVATLNPDTPVWKELTIDERQLIARRSTSVIFTHSYACAAAAFLKRTTPGEIIRAADGPKRREYISVEFQLNAVSHPDTCMLTKNLECVEQLLKLELRGVEEQQATYLDITCPMPTCDYYTVILDSPTAPTTSGTSVLDKQKKPVNLWSIANVGITAKLATLITKLTQYTFIDRKNVVPILNRANLTIDPEIGTIVILSSEWKVGASQLATEDGENSVMVFNIDDSLQVDYSPFEGGFWFNTTIYTYEHKVDYTVSQTLARLYKKIDEFKLTIADKAIEVPTIDAIAAPTSLRRIFTSAVAVADGLSQMFAIATLISPQEHKKRVRFEARDRTYSDASSYNPYKYTHGSDAGSTTGTLSSWGSRSSIASDTSRNAQDSEDTRNLKKQAPKPDLSYNWRTGQRFEAKENTFYMSNAVKFRSKGTNDDWQVGMLFTDKVYYWEKNTQMEKWVCYARSIDKLELKFFMNMHCSTVGRSYYTPLVGASVDLSISEYFPEVFCLYTTGMEDINYSDEDLSAKEVLKQDERFKHTNHNETQRQGAYDPQTTDQANILIKNFVEIVDADQKILNGIMLCDRTGVTNAHAPNSFTIRLPGTTQEYTTETIIRHKHNDLLFFRVTDKTFKSVKDVTKLLMRDEELERTLSSTSGRYAAMLVIPQGQNAPIVNVVHGETELRMTKVTTKNHMFKYGADIGFFGSTGVTRYGDCGAPLLLMAPNIPHKWCGIHSRGAADVSLSTPITYEYVQSILGRKQESDQHTEPHQAVVRHEHIRYEDVPFQCPATNLRVVGKPKKPVHIPSETRKHKTGLNIKSGTEPTVKSKYDPRNPSRRDMLEEGIARYGEQLPKKFQLSEITHAAAEVANYFASLLLAKDLTTRTLTNTEAINGAPRIEFEASKPIDRSGSVGFPYVQTCPQRTTKGDFLEQRANGKWYFRSNDKLAQEILTRVDTIVRDGARGVAHDEVWSAYSKDECVKLEKIYDVDKMKTRVFFSGSMSYQLAYRRYFGAAIWRIHETFHDHPIKVGITATGLDWHRLAAQHLSVSSEGFASDMSNWDGTVPIEFLQAIPHIYNTIYKATDPNWTPKDDMIRRTIHRAVEGANVLVRDRVYKLDQAMASGFPGTAVENSMINMMLFYCCFVRIVEPVNPQYANFRDFMRLIKLSVYGDDNIYTVSPLVSEYFHFNSFKKEAIDFGFKVTDSQKTGSEVPNLMPFLKLDFLKRNFRTSEYGFIVGPLALTSIRKQLEWISGPKYLYKGTWRHFTDTRLIENQIMAIWGELALHGPETFELVAEEIRAATKGTKVQCWILSYQQAIHLTEYGVYSREYALSTNSLA
jgi:hypothetical protein